MSERSVDAQATILDFLETSQGQTARDIADALELEKFDVLTACREMQRDGEVQQDPSYRWWAGDTAPVVHRHDSALTSQVTSNLGALCRYYLDCITHDSQDRISTFASIKYAPNYVELSCMPSSHEELQKALETEEVQALLARGKRSKKHLQPILGYPIRLTYMRSKRSDWEGYIVESLSYYRLEKDGAVSKEMFRIPPTLNTDAIGYMSGLSGRERFQHALSLAVELGFHEDEFYGEFDEVVERMRAMEPAWPYREDLHPAATKHDVPISELSEEGIYNRCVIMLVEGSNITRGLENELGALALKTESDTRGTALGAWLTARGPRRETDLGPLLEVVPLNAEQRAAVQSGLTQDLTVVTGPPGTGKSQVVLSLLINAAWRGMTALFASRNNKAVDVVETRLNGLSSRHALLRLGRRTIQASLSDHLQTLLSASVTPEDRTQYEHALQELTQLADEYRAASGRIEKAVALRNEVDQLEGGIRQIESARGRSLLQRLRHLDCARMREALDNFTQAAQRADRQAQSILVRLLWFRTGARRLEDARKTLKQVRILTDPTGIEALDREFTEGTLSAWGDWTADVAEQVQVAEKLQHYYTALEQLRSEGDVSKHCEELAQLQRSMEARAQDLWKLWLRVKPSNMSQSEREALQEYSTILQLRVQADEENRRISGQYYRKFQSLFPKVVQGLPSWAITSLSARGRLPMEPGLFDLLIIDEASQCDIASTLPLLYRAKRVVVIGDPNQLRHISSLPQPKDMQLLARHGMVESGLGWLYSVNSLFDKASGLCHSEDLVDLRDHYRSHADIISFANQEFYEGRLRVATKYDRLLLETPDGPAVRWVDVKGVAERPSSGSAVNRREAERVVQELKLLVQERGYEGTVGVVSPFRAQANLIRDLVAENEELSSLLSQREFESNTTHSFQGDERDAMLFSPVISDGSDSRSERFLQNTANLFNVAITRARSVLIVVGNREYAMTSKVKHLGRFAKYADSIARRSAYSDGEGAVLGGQLAANDETPWQSEWEDVLRDALQERGLVVETQVPVDKYFLDLVIQAGDRKLDIEVDGENYHRAWDGELIRGDQLRNMRMFELGWDVMRFWVYQVRDDLDWCVEKVLDWAGKHDIPVEESNGNG